MVNVTTLVGSGATGREFARDSHEGQVYTIVGYDDEVAVFLPSGSRVSNSCLVAGVLGTAVEQLAEADPQAGAAARRTHKPSLSRSLARQFTRGVSIETWAPVVPELTKDLCGRMRGPNPPVSFVTGIRRTGWNQGLTKCQARTST